MRIRHGHHERGIALIAVLWTLTILGLLAAAIGKLTNAESVLVRNLALNAKVEALANAGIHRALALLLENETMGAEFDIAMADGIVRVSIADEDGKIDLNAAGHETLMRLLSGAGKSPSSAHRIADAIIDYRDPDHDRRAFGAERPDYEAAGRRQGPKNQAFEFREELMLVLGVDKSLYQRLYPAVTVVTGSATFDPRVSSPQALHALPPTLKAWSHRLADFQMSDPLAMALPSDSRIAGTRRIFYTLQSTACLRSQKARFVRQVLVKVNRRHSARPYEIMAWNQPLFVSTDASPCRT